MVNTMATATINYVDLPMAAGVSRRCPIQSSLWIQIKTFAFKKDAIAFCDANGLSRSMVQKRFGRFEYAWVLMSGTHAMAK